jgi:hypothetical protein
LKDCIGTFIFAKILYRSDVYFLLQQQSAAVKHYKKEYAHQFNPGEDVKDRFRGRFSELQNQKE